MNPKPFLVLSPIHRSIRAIDRYLSRIFQPKGFSVKEAHLLGYLLYYSPCTVNNLINVLGVKNSTLTSMITRLEDKELLKRKINSEDKRSFEIILTAKGKRVSADFHKYVRELEEKILKKLSNEDVNSLKKIVVEIEEVCK
ncbi:MAG: MarR family transcriptional regulator [Bacteroidetes bacterium]|nr:MarR family transcriptional regulator [Bacteroidota bacterium]